MKKYPKCNKFSKLGVKFIAIAHSAALCRNYGAQNVYLTITEMPGLTKVFRVIPEVECRSSLQRRPENYIKIWDFKKGLPRAKQLNKRARKVFKKSGKPHMTTKTWS